MSTTPAPSIHRFDAYRLAYQFRSIVVPWLPLRRSELSDQLDRASISVPLNIAEGAEARVVILRLLNVLTALIRR